MLLTITKKSPLTPILSRKLALASLPLRIAASASRYGRGERAKRDPFSPWGEGQDEGVFFPGKGHR